MKYVFLLLILTSCGYNAIDNTNYVIVTDIESGTNGGPTELHVKGCYYYVKGATYYRRTSGSYFFDECGKFTVGDTIKIIKR